MNFLGGNIFWMNWHFNFKQCRLFNSRSISTIESPLRSWRFPFSQLFFSLFLGGQSAPRFEKSAILGESQKRPGRWNGVNDFKNLAKRQFFVAIFFLISEHCVESWKFCSRSFRALVLLNCPNSKLYEEAVGYCGKNAKVDTIWKLAIFIWKWVHILFRFFLFFSKNIFWVPYSFLKKSIIVKFSKS